MIVGASVLSQPKAKGEEVYMAKAATKDLTSFVSATGRIEARTKVNVQSSVIGEIRELPVKEGDVVKKGDLLVQIDPVRYRTEVDRLQSARPHAEDRHRAGGGLSRELRAEVQAEPSRSAATAAWCPKRRSSVSELDFNSRTIDLQKPQGAGRASGGQSRPRAGRPLEDDDPLADGRHGHEAERREGRDHAHRDDEQSRAP